MVLTIAMIAAFVWVIRFFGLEDRMRELLEWIDGLGVWGPVIFIALDLLAMVLMLPGIMFTLGAGFIFGWFEGFTYVWLARAGGGVLTFLIGRHLIPERMLQHFLRNKRMQMMNEGVVDAGWKFIFLTRIVPFFPFKLSNYVFGRMGFRLRDFVIGNSVGIVLYTATNVYIGSLAEDFSSLGEENDTPMWVYILGLVALVVLIGYVNRIARRSFKQYIPEAEDETESEA